MKNRSLSFKMYFVMAILIAGAIVIASVGMSRMNNIQKALHRIVDENAKRVSMIKDIRAVFYLQLMNERNYIIESDAEKAKRIEGLMGKRHTELLEDVDHLYQISSDLGKEELTKFKETYSQWWSNVQEIKVFVEAGDRAKALLHSEQKGFPIRQAGEAIIGSTVKRNEERMAKDALQAEHDYVDARELMVGASIFSILLGLVVGTWILQSVGKTISRIINDLSNSSSQVSAASQQIASASVELSQATTEQASSLEETVATIEELTSMVKVNSENAKQASTLSGQTSDIVARGEKEMRSLISSMSEISQDSKKISEIIAVIDDIAFQTNLLALNAAVEAARAGEQGKGFAVVAEAVRTLAHRSSLAAKDITDLIKSSVSRIEVGSEQVEKSGKVLAEILEAVTKVVHLNQEISTASGEQSNGIQQISKAMNQLDQVTQVNAASSEEAAASAEELSAQADSLTGVIADLVHVVHGNKNTKERTKTVVTAVEKTRLAKKVPTSSFQKSESSNKNEDLLPLRTVG